MSKFVLVFLIFLSFMKACQAELPTRMATAPALLLTRPPTPIVLNRDSMTNAPVVPTSTATPIPTEIPIMESEYYLFGGLGVPVELVMVGQQVANENPERFSWQDNQIEADNIVRLTIQEGLPLSEWTYVVVAPFATVQNRITFEEVKAGWENGSNGFGQLIIDTETEAALSHLLGPPAGQVSIVNFDDLLNILWSSRPAWSIIPFHRLTPELKVITLDGQSPLAKDFVASNYPLKVFIGASGDQIGSAQLIALWPASRSNYDPDKITRVAMSGVTALGRATAYQMEIGGITTPGQVVGPVMQSADIAHISHEVPFASDCPYPNPIGDPVFCARDSYLTLIQSIGTDVVELTGNHVNDWGPSNLLHSIDLYESAGMKTFGGGRNLAEASKPALFEHNGNKIAFVGCNPVGPAFAWATDEHAGSQPCDYDAFYNQIRDLRAASYLVIATLQYNEFYHYAATPQQQADFRAVADAGAAAVSGSQGHHAQGFDFHNGSFIHYGLGNLFFDQMDMLGTRQSFIDTYVISDGRLVSVDLFTSLIENYCCPRLMTEAERAQLLEAVFQASGW